MVLTCQSLSELPDLAQAIINFAQDCKVWTFRGDLGAGKTTLIKAVCKVMGVEEDMSSPSFALVNEYKTQDKQTLYHLDLYRLKDEQEAFLIGLEDYIDSGSFCFIEWPQVAFGLLNHFLDISVSLEINSVRTINLTFYERL